jgi:hypothetical protein
MTTLRGLAVTSVIVIGQILCPALLVVGLLMLAKLI